MGQYELRYQGTLENRYVDSARDMAQMFLEMGLENASYSDACDAWDSLRMGRDLNGVDDEGNPWKMSVARWQKQGMIRWVGQGQSVAWINDDGTERIRVDLPEDFNPRDWNEEDEGAPRRADEMYTVKVWPIAADPGVKLVRGIEPPHDWEDKWYRCGMTSNPRLYEHEEYQIDGGKLFRRYLQAFHGTRTFFQWQNGDDLYMTFDTAEWRERMGTEGIKGISAYRDFKEYMWWCRPPGLTLVHEIKRHHCWSEMKYGGRVIHDASVWELQGKRTGFISHDLDELGIWGREAFGIRLG